ncbi:thermonuclease family protein [Qipengyuania sp. DSG2-2]|uniref:thermonuclease family protein n=1 Tax=Qipengyuania sp. DGS2-2 TaxID=3349631 RepID=UPI0036D212C1
MAKVVPLRRSPKQQSSIGFVLIVVALFLGAFSAVFFWDGGGRSGSAATFTQSSDPGTRITGKFARCGNGQRITCVVDGDTIWANGVKIRMADYNTPEISNPGCEAERRLGERATTRLTTLLNSGGVTIHQTGDRDTDVYGRALREVRVDGRSVGDTLVEEGLAHEWEGYQRDWC